MVELRQMRMDRKDRMILGRIMILTVLQLISGREEVLSYYLDFWYSVFLLH